MTSSVQPSVRPWSGQKPIISLFFGYFSIPVFKTMVQTPKFDYFQELIYMAIEKKAT